MLPNRVLDTPHEPDWEEAFNNGAVDERLCSGDGKDLVLKFL